MNRPARLNRVLLLFFGFVLIVLAAFVLAVRFGKVPMIAPDTTLVPGTEAPPIWVFYLIAAVAIVVGLLMLRWLLAQLTRRPKTHTWRFEENPDRGRTELAASTAVEPFLSEVNAYPGVRGARGALAGSRSNPALAMIVNIDQDADLATIRQRIAADGLPRLRQALDLDALPVTAEFRFASTTLARVQ
jgi:hypothetical protein